MENHVTKREMFEALLSFANGGDLAFENDNGVVNVDYDALAAFAENEIALLDKKAAKARETAAKKRAETDELLELVRSVMSTEEFEITADIAARVEGGDDLTIGKIQNRLNILVRNGEAEKQQITVPATETSKARKAMAYRLMA